MLSVLIPVYNFDVKNLVEALSQQAVALGVEFEILLIDDGSVKEIKLKNRELLKVKGVVYQEEPENLGRSKIRNKLSQEARYDNLIFMDCDSAVPDANYLKNYLNAISRAPVVYGGTIYSSTCDRLESKQKLHWLHGIKREQSTATNRNQFPNRSFKTNNFYIRKDVFSQIGFNEKIQGYGHEDTLFGYELAKNNINVLHIDNPVIHLGLESSEEFLRKTREGIKNLKRIMRINGNEKRLVRDITLLSYYKKLKQIGLDKAFYSIYTRYEHRLRKNLLSSHPNLVLFDLYKLGYLCSLNGEV